MAERALPFPPGIAAFACLSAMSRYMSGFMAPEVVADILFMIGSDFATGRCGGQGCEPAALS